MKEIEELQNLINKSHHIVAFSGAGVSTASGLKDFRSSTGLYHMDYEYSPELILSHDFFMCLPDKFYTFYKEYLNALNAKPNVVHTYLKHLEDLHKLDGIITQNIDGLHTMAGSKTVCELHGSIYRNHCLKCHKSYEAKEVFYSKANIPLCTCGGLIKPDVILYNESLDEKVIEESISLLEHADLLLILGTSLTVYPASSLIEYYQGQPIVIINQDKTNQDSNCTIVIHDSLINVFRKLN